MWKAAFTSSTAESISTSNAESPSIVDSKTNQIHVTIIELANVPNLQHKLVQVSATVFSGTHDQTIASTTCRTGAVPVTSDTVEINDLFIFNCDKEVEKEQLFVQFEIIDKHIGTIGASRTKNVKVYNPWIEHEEILEVSGTFITLEIRIGVRGVRFAEHAESEQ
jgi:hypothetical protein